MTCTVQIGSVSITTGLVFVDRWQQPRIVQSVAYTLAGAPVWAARFREKGRLITLEAREDTGWITRAQAESLLAMAEQPGAVFAFSYAEVLVEGNFNFSANVIFAHHAPPALSLSPLEPFCDWHTGTIKLLTV